MNNDVWYGIVALAPVKYGDLPVEKHMEWDRMDGYLKAGLIPVANNRGGDNYYVDPENGSVYLIFADDYDHPKPISASFQEFLDRFTIRED